MKRSFIIHALRLRLLLTYIPASSCFFSNFNPQKRLISSFYNPSSTTKTTTIHNSGDEHDIIPPMRPKACIVGYIPVEQKEELMIILQSAGYDYCDNPETIGDDSTIFSYKYIKASGMLKLVNNDNHTHDVDTYEQAPKYIPVQSGEEKVLVDNGWSFLDPDESEPTVSEFNIEDDEYKPKWGHTTTTTSDNSGNLILSTLGFNLQRLNSEEILSEANTKISYEQSREVLLKGKTDKPYVKLTNNGYDFSGSIVHLEEGLFTCAIGGNPLFTTNDLSPLTASSGWLSFTRVLSDHITLVYPENTDVIDQRIEVVDAKTGCHLGHYFKQDGFCINASALNFFPSSGSQQSSNDHWNTNSNPISWLGLKSNNHNSISIEIIQRVLQQNIQTHTILLGAGCFWHTESALRRLPGILDTKVGYSGGCVASPTYEDICDGDTGHAEVVKVIFDPEVCEPKKLMHCFLAMHDPTVIRPNGKRAQKTGQYRSCVFTFDSYMEKIALDAISECSAELGKILSTEVTRLDNESSLFWLAEDRHQLHNERRKISQNDNVVDTKTLSFDEWLLEYARRSSSIFGPNKQNPYFDSFDDGMARMMI